MSEYFETYRSEKYTHQINFDPFETLLFMPHTVSIKIEMTGEGSDRDRHIRLICY